jgi:hypothetical protein
VIENIEEFRPEFKRNAFPNGGVFVKPEIPVVKPRPTKEPPAGIAETA